MAAPRAERGVAHFEAFRAGKTRTVPLYDPADRTVPWDANDPRHGTVYAYAHGCLCHWCRAAGEAYRRYRKLGLTLPKGWNARDHN